MKIPIVMLMLACFAMAIPASADELPGTPRREFRARTYYYQPISYYCPVWYAGNGVIATRKKPGVPLWSGTTYNKIY